MFKEIAVDPQTLNNWLMFRDIVQDCGVEHGRLISDYPRGSWKWNVWNGICRNAGNSEMDRKRIEVFLERAVLWDRRRGPFESRREWLRQAEEEHRRRPFSAIIASINPNQHEGVLIASEMDKYHAAWRSAKTQIVDRTANALAAAAAPLFSISNTIRLVDPHFAPWERRYTSSLRAFAFAIRSENPRIGRFEYHLKHKTDPSKPAFKSECHRRLQTILPSGLELQLFIWKQRPGGEALHRRYILTEKGGLGYDHGLDEGKPGEKTDVELLSSEAHQKRWNDFDPRATERDSTFELVDQCVLRSMR